MLQLQRRVNERDLGHGGRTHRPARNGPRDGLSTCVRSHHRCCSPPRVAGPDDSRRSWSPWGAPRNCTGGRDSAGPVEGGGSRDSGYAGSPGYAGCPRPTDPGWQCGSRQRRRVVLKVQSLLHPGVAYLHSTRALIDLQYLDAAVLVIGPGGQPQAGGIGSTWPHRQHQHRVTAQSTDTDPHQLDRGLDGRRVRRGHGRRRRRILKPKGVALQDNGIGAFRGKRRHLTHRGRYTQGCQHPNQSIPSSCHSSWFSHHRR